MVGTLLTNNGLELPCVILPVQRQLFPLGKEVLVYCQNRLVKGYIDSDDESLVAEIEIIIEYCDIPKYNNELQSSSQLSELFF